MYVNSTVSIALSAFTGQPNKLSGAETDANWPITVAPIDSA